MSESFDDQLSRLRQMSVDKGQTWDLSPNDQAALNAVLHRLDMLDAQNQELREQLACACDLVNSWCRERGVTECNRPYADLNLRNTIDALWDKMSWEYMKASEQ